MKYDFPRKTKTVKEIFDEFSSGKLIVDSSYQRRKVWNDQDKIRLIETIILEYVVPEVFFWISNLDPDTGESLTHIVDGQQRIDTIVSFLNDEFCLEPKHLIDEEIKSNYCNLYFSQLPGPIKSSIWSYPISIVQIDSDRSIDDIKKMFYRLNLTNYNLNNQEKRNSKDSVFGDMCDALSTNDFWNDLRVFSSNDAKRMKDVEYCASIYILANQGIADQTNGRIINNYYDDYKAEFDNDRKLTEKITKSMEMILALTDKTTLLFISKKAQMYTMFCMTFKMIDNNIDLEDDIFKNQIFKKFKFFVNVYTKFRNEYENEYDDPKLTDLFDKVKKYKLASSEGVNKISNRVIRFETLYDICVENTTDIVTLEQLLDDFESKLKNKRVLVDTLEDDDKSGIQINDY